MRLAHRIIYLMVYLVRSSSWGWNQGYTTFHITLFSVVLEDINLIYVELQNPFSWHWVCIITNIFWKHILKSISNFLTNYIFPFWMNNIDNIGKNCNASNNFKYLHLLQGILQMYPAFGYAESVSHHCHWWSLQLQLVESILSGRVGKYTFQDEKILIALAPFVQILNEFKDMNDFVIMYINLIIIFTINYQVRTLPCTSSPRSWTVKVCRWW